MRRCVSWCECWLDANFEGGGIIACGGCRKAPVRGRQSLRYPSPRDSWRVPRLMMPLASLLEQVALLLKLTERYCVVLQTLKGGAELTSILI